MTSPALPPVKQSITVAASVERAFDHFTAGMGRWWLKSHSVNPSKAAIRDVVIEPKAGGRWYELGDDGAQCDWGKVIIWERPHRVVLAWQLNAQWQYDPALITEVEVTFTPQTGTATRVDFEHRNLERFGAAAAQVRELISGAGGWTALLAAYAGSA